MGLGRFLVAAFLASVLTAQGAWASIIVQAFYRLGDADPGAAANAIGNDTTKDSSGNGRDLTRMPVNWDVASEPHYKNDKVAPTIYANALSAYFAGGDYAVGQPVVRDRYNRSGALTMGSYWGMEAWICPTSVVLTRTMFPVFNGNSADDGAGFRMVNGKMYGRVNGTNVGSFTYNQNEWMYVAIVQNGTDATFYAKQGSGSFQPIGNISTATPVNPTAPSGFQIGAKWSDNGSNAFTGYVDEVRVFTFNPGEFSTADLLVNTTALPEPGAIGVLSLGLLLLRRRR
jgi:hypothetical protein